MKFKSLLLLSVIALFSSCSIPRNKAAGYEDKITGSITITISTTCQLSECVEWSNNLETNLIAKFKEQGIQANVTQLGYTSKEAYMRDTKIKDNYILHIEQIKDMVRYKVPGNSSSSNSHDGIFVITLFDRKINKEVWKAEIWANFYSYNTNPKTFSTALIKILKEDNLL